MKTIKLSFALLLGLLFCGQAIAQTAAAGVYLTYDDYASHKLSYADAGTTLRLHEAFGSNKLTVVQGGKKQELLKSEMFGYRSNNQDYRFYKGVAYLINQSKDISIYSCNTLVPAGKGMKQATAYFFSATPTGPVEKLSISNIETAYAGKPKFRYLVESLFKSDGELTAYDAAVNEFKIQYVYNEAAK